MKNILYILLMLFVGALCCIPPYTPPPLSAQFTAVKVTFLWSWLHRKSRLCQATPLRSAFNIPLGPALKKRRYVTRSAASRRTLWKTVFRYYGADAGFPSYERSDNYKDYEQLALLAQLSDTTQRTTNTSYA